MNIVYFAKHWPRRGVNGHLEKSINTIQTLLNESYKVTVCSSDPELGHKQILRQYPLEQLVDIHDKKIMPNLISSKIKPDIAIFDSPETQSKYSAYIYNKWNKCPRILQMKQLKRLQNWRKQNYKTVLPNTIIPPNSPMYPDKVQDIFSVEELRSIYRSDFVFMGNEFHYYLLKKFTKAKFFTHTSFGLALGEYTEMIKNIQFRPFENRQNFLFYANLDKFSNQQALQTLIHEVWPLILQKLPQVQLHIWGIGKDEHITKNISALKQKNVILKGYMEDNYDIQKYKALLYPCKYSAGVRTKIIDSWLNHLPVITTPIGAEGNFLQVYDPLISSMDNQSRFMNERIITQTQKKDAQKVKNYYDNRSLSKKIKELAFGGSCKNFTVSQFAESAIKMYSDKDYWNQNIKIGQKIVQKNQNEYQLANILKHSITKSELAAYEGRNRSVYEDEWKRYVKSQQFYKKMKG